MRAALWWLMLGACRAPADGRAEDDPEVIGQAGEEGTPMGPTWGGGVELVSGPEALAGAGSHATWTFGAADCWHDVVAPGDLDGDGIPDVGVTCRNPNQLLIRSGAGGDAPIASLALASTANAVELGDVDGDAVPDLGAAPEATVGGVQASTYRALVVPGAAVDGDVDAAAVGWTITGDEAYFRELLPFAAGDLDADGLADVAVAAHRASFPGPDDGLLCVVAGSTLAASAGGTNLSACDAAIASPVGTGPIGAAGGPGDVDGDGRDDLLAVPYPWLRDGAGDGTVTTSIYVASGAALPSAITDAPHLDFSPAAGGSGRVELVRVGDLDGDGRAEIAAARFQNVSSEELYYDLAVVPGAAVPATGGLALDPYVLTKDGTGHLVACDLDGDGLPELVTDAGIWAGTDLLTPGAPPVAPSPVVSNQDVACVGDLDGDGTEDLAISHYPDSSDPT